MSIDYSSPLMMKLRRAGQQLGVLRPVVCDAGAGDSFCSGRLCERGFTVRWVDPSHLLASRDA